MPPAQKPTGAEGAARALSREQPVAADAATPTPVNNESAGAEGAEFIAQDLSQDPPGNDDLLRRIRHFHRPPLICEGARRLDFQLRQHQRARLYRLQVMRGSG